MKHQRSILAATTVLFCAVAGLISSPAPAQEADLGEAIISVDVQVVNLLATVRNKKGVLVSDLTRGDFEVYEDGVLQEIRYFSRQSDLPLTIGLLIDTSVSQVNLVGVERSAGYRFFEKVLRPDRDLAFLMSFDIDVELLQDLTSSRHLLQQGLEQLEVQGATRGVTPGTVPTGGRVTATALFDSVYLAAGEMLKPQSGRKAIVLISDGVDYGSKVDLDEAVEAAQRSDVIVFGVRYFDQQFYYRSGAVAGGGGGFGVLRKLSRPTGGEVFDVKRKQPLDGILDEIDQTVRNQYSIGFTPKRDLSQTGFRQIELRLRDKGLKALTREGYYPSEL